MIPRERVVAQLKRLTMFGNLNDLELDGYIRALSKHSEEDLSYAIGTIIETYVSRHFPYPAEIVSFIRDAKSRREAIAKEVTYSAPVKCAGSKNFWPAFALVWSFGDSNRRKYWIDQVCRECPDSEKVDDKMMDDYYVGVIHAMRDELSGYKLTKEKSNVG